MNKFLIINADGYGFTRGINRGIDEAVAHGVITSVSVNANFPAIDDLPQFARNFPHVSIGVHLNPVVGRPLARPAEIPSMVNAQGEFHYHQFAQKLMDGAIDLDEMFYELSLQISSVRIMV